MRSVGVILLALVAVSSANAAASPRYKVTVEAWRTTTWTISRTDSACTGVTVATTGAGREAVSFRTAKPLLVSAAALRAGLFFPVSGTATRQGSLTQTFAGGPCNYQSIGYLGCYAVSALLGSYYGAPTQTPCPGVLAAPTDGCGTKTFTFRRGLLGIDDGVLGLELMVSEPLFRGCPGLGSAPRGILPASLGVSLDSLARKRVRTVSGSSEMFYADVGFPTEPGLSGQTRASWKVRFERVG